MPPRSLDFNLLAVLDALLQNRSVTKTAQQLHLSQPAVSASLARLRRYFDDELLARTGNHYRLTPLALELKGRVRLALVSVERAFEPPREFDPALTRRDFSLIVSDYVVAVIGSGIAEILDDEAPLSRLNLIANTPQLVDRANQVLLGVDLLIVPHGAVFDLNHEDLFRDEWLCLISADNRHVQDKLTVDHLNTLPWVATFHSPTAATPAEQYMRLIGVTPRIQLVTENFLTVPALIVSSARVALLQRRLVQQLPDTSGLRALPPPVEVGPLVEAMWWHPVRDNDPEHTYLRDVVRRASARVQPFR